MRLSSRFATLLAALLLACLPFVFGQETTSRAQLAENYGNLPLSFEANQGQADAKVRFLSRGNGYSLLLTDSSAVLALTRNDSRPDQPGSKPAVKKKTDIVRMELAGATPNLQVAGAEPLPGKANYFIGNDPSRWHSNVPTYSQVKYPGVYPGVDLVYYGNQRQLEYDFVVAPGVDPHSIRLQFAGVTQLKLAADGDLTISTANCEIAFHRPVVYQVVDGQRQRVTGTFSLRTRNTVGFTLGEYDHAKPLVIDPVLVYSTYLGGTNGGNRGDYGSSVAVDSSGNVYVTGTANSTNFPLTENGYQLVNNAAGSGANAFVTKLNSTGTALIYSTYLGGSDNDYANGIAVDSSGNAYVAGAAYSSNFPVTPGALQTTSAGGINAFIAKLNPTGSALLYSTYLGGKANTTDGDYANAIAVDSSGDAYLTGRASSSTFPVTSGAYQTTNKNFALGNAFVAEINPAGSALLYATYLGGSRVGNTGDSGNGIAIDSEGNAYVTGFTYSTTFPTTFGVYSTVNLGQENAFVTKLNPTGTALVYSTYLGGNYADGGSGIAVDSSGDAYVTGVAASQDFPTTSGALQPKFGYTTLGGSNAFVTKFNPTGTQLIYSTYLGGNGEGDEGNAISLDKMGDAYVTGKTQATNFPVTNGAFQTTNSAYGSAAFISKIDPTGSTLLYSTYLGGSGLQGVGGDLGYAIAVNSSGDAFITGRAYSTNFPVTTGAYQITNRAAADESSNAFVAKLAIGGETTTAVTSSANPQLYGFPITFTAAVTANFSNAIPTGNAVFTIDSGTPITVALDDTGKATYESSSLTYTPGSPTHTVQVSYSGDSNFLVSSSSLNELIIGPPHSISIVSGSVQTTVYGSAFASPLVVIVKDINGNPVPSASVTFGGSGLQFSANPVTTGSNGEATVTATAIASGSLTATASVTGVNTVASFSLTATKVLLTLTAINVNVAYNQPIPVLSFSPTGFVNGDTFAVLSGAPSETTTAVKGSAPGTYLITISQGTLAAANYTFNFVNGSLTILKASQTITFGPLSNAAYGTTPITLTATTNSGLTVSYAVSGPATVTGSTLTITSVGKVTVTASQAGNADYNAATAVSQSFTVTPAILTVAANNANTIYDQAIPAFAYTVTGFVNGDTKSVLNGAPVETTTATKGSIPASYPITIAQGTLAAANYTFTFISGVLTIKWPPNALELIPVTPCRIVDTRNATSAFGGPELSAQATRTFNVPQSGCGIPSSAVAYSLNVTVVPTTSLGYLTIWPAGLSQPTVSTLNSDGRVKANATITPAGANGGVSVFASDATQFILDIDGYFVPAGTNASGLEFYPLTPCRIADTRNATGALGGPSLTGGVGRAFPVQSSSCGIPSTAKAYSLNITAVPHGSLGYLTTWPTGQSQPVVSTLNSSTGVVAANAAIVPAGTGGDISIFVSDTADMILDVNGYFAPPATGGLSLYTVTPCRALDTRNGAGAFDGTLTVPIHGSACAPPATAQAYVLNATVIPTASLSYLTLWPAGGSQPNVSTLNASDGAVTSNMAIVPTTNGSIDAFATDSTQLILDISSYFAP